jgi:tetratricopeptide (TPR) repeat protein
MKPWKKINIIKNLCLLFLISLHANIKPEMSNEASYENEDYVQLAENLKKEGNIDKAITIYKKALAIEASNYNACFNLANLLYEQNKIGEAIIYYQKVNELKPDSSAVYFNLGICHATQNDYSKASDAFLKTIELNPKHTKAYYQLVVALHKQNKFNEALEYAKKGIELDPCDFELLLRAASLYKHFDKFSEAISLYRKAVELNPKHINAILELANALNMTDETDEALKLYQRILEINPKIIEALYNFGFTLKKQGHIKEAMEIYHKILEMKPTYAQPHFSLSLSYLTLGDFERGWKEYEWRWAAYNETPRKYKQPQFDGTDIAGKTILLYAEQGLGDTLQFIRYAKLIKDRGGKVIFDTQKPLKQILSLAPYLDKVITQGDPVPDFDYHLALMSLPLIFKTTLNTVPNQIPYLYADQNLVESWRTTLSCDKNFKIGLCWQGNAGYSTQFLRKAVAAKSFHVKEFEPLCTMKGISLYSLQKMNGHDQLKDASYQLNIHDFGSELDEKHGRFMDTAAIIKNLDLVITVDTSISHFAAALGVPVWILLPNPADWRWMLDRTDTPWYPNVRLFRQPKFGDWKSVIQDVIAALQKLVAKPHESYDPAYNINIASSDDLSEIIDALTLLSLETEQPQRKLNKFNQLQKIYDSYVEQYPELPMLMTHMLEINKQLNLLDTQLQKNKNQSVFDAHFKELSRKIYFAHDIKAYLKKKIAALQTKSMD